MLRLASFAGLASFIRVAAFGIVSFAAALGNADVRLQGAGASFPNPLYQRWVSEYQKSHPDVKIDYQSIGSGGGIKGITEKTLDFAGSDAPMTRSEKEKVGADVVHIPTVAGAVVLAVNIPGLNGELKLDGPTVADIFEGKITQWNDPKITGPNTGLALPDAPIVPVYRSDSSGTSFVFTNYLATQSESFKENVGVGKQVKFPLGQGGKGNEGVAAAVQSSSGSIGYIELNYATANKIPFALMKNKAGQYVKASGASVAAAGAGAVSQMGESLAVNIWNQDGNDAYPISAFTYLIVYKDLAPVKDQAKAKELVDFLKWAVTDGEKLADEMGYAPLAEAVQAKATAAIESLEFNGAAVK